MFQKSSYTKKKKKIYYYYYYYYYLGGPKSLKLLLHSIMNLNTFQQHQTSRPKNDVILVSYSNNKKPERK